MAESVRCPRCREEFEAPALGAARASCPFCQLEMLWLRREPAADAEPDAMAPRQASEAACFFHAENPAPRACPECGRYICSLCTIAAGGRSLCPLCFERAHAQQALREYRDRDTLYDSVALAAGWGWALFYPAWIVALPAVIYWTIAKGSNPKHYVVPRSSWRFALAMAGVLVLPVALVLGFFAVATHFARPR